MVDPAPKTSGKKAYEPAFVYIAEGQGTLFETDYYDPAVGAATPKVGFHVFGKCPRCEHWTNDLVPLQQAANRKSDFGHALGRGLRRVVLGGSETFTTDAGFQVKENPLAPSQGLISCKCAHVHTPLEDAIDGTKPAGTIGCGAYWVVKLQKSDTKKSWQAAIQEDNKELSRTWIGAQQADTSGNAALSSAQGVATKWQTALTAILGLLVVTTLIGGRDTLSSLSGVAQVLIGIFAVLSLVTNVWAIYRFNLASNGAPGSVGGGAVTNLEDADLAPLLLARKAQDWLESALKWAGVSFVTTLVALGLVWFWPGAKIATNFEISVTVPVPEAKPSTTVTCGTVSYDPKAMTFTLTPKEKSPKIIDSMSYLVSVGAPC